MPIGVMPIIEALRFSEVTDYFTVLAFLFYRRRLKAFFILW